MTATIDQELLQELRDRIAHSLVFAEATEHTVKEAFELVRRIGEKGENDG
jgi:hypothetical protein